MLGKLLAEHSKASFFPLMLYKNECIVTWLYENMVYSTVWLSVFFSNSYTFWSVGTRLFHAEILNLVLI